MQQFDISEIINPSTRGRYPFVVVLQHECISAAITIIVAPVVEASAGLATTRLHPTLEISGRQYLLIIEELAAVHRRSVGRTIGSAEPFRCSIIAALDLCFTSV